MKKIIVIGCPGAGKSTFARKLRDATGIPLYYLDMLYHKPDKTIVKREEFDIGLNDIIKKDNWIIDGNYQRTLELRLRECDTVFFRLFFRCLSYGSRITRWKKTRGYAMG